MAGTTACFWSTTSSRSFRSAATRFTTHIKTTSTASTSRRYVARSNPWPTMSTKYRPVWRPASGRSISIASRCPSVGNGLRGTAVYGGGSTIDVPIAISGGSFYYLPTHEINAGVVLLAYRMDKDGTASQRAPQPKADITAEQWGKIKDAKWDWDTLLMPRLDHVLKQGLPERMPGTRMNLAADEAPPIRGQDRRCGAGPHYPPAPHGH